MSPVDLSSTPLYSGTVFTLTCVVELVSEVDTTVTVLTSWYKDGSMISSSSRILLDSEATQNTASMYIYVRESDVVFNPLNNMESGGDDGNYTCSAEVQNDDYITGSSNNGTQTIVVEGQWYYMYIYACTHVHMYVLYSRSGPATSECDV